MIKTKNFNDFSDYNYEQLYNFDFMYNEIKKFIENGGDIDLPVLKNSYRLELMTFKDFCNSEESLGNVFLNKIMSLNGKDKYFEFKIENNKVIENKYNNLEYMNRNFDAFSQDIINSFKTLVNKINDGKNYDFISYDNNELKTNPILKILRALEFNPKLLDIALNNKEFKVLFEKHFDTSEKQLKIIFKGEEYNKLAVIYSHDIMPEILDNYSRENILEEWVRFGNLEILRKASLDTNFQEHFKPELFLSANSKETVEFLLSFDLSPINKNIVNEYDNIVFLNINKPLEVIDSILNSCPKDFVFENSKKLYRIFFEYLKEDKIDLLINKYNFDLKVIDPYEAISKISNLSLEQVENKLKSWFDLGADPSNCYNFVSKKISDRDTKLMSYLKKKNLIDIYCPEALRAFFKSNNTQKTRDFFSKIEESHLTKYTKSGIPVWFTIKNIEDQKFLKLVKNKNQLSKDNCSWLFYKIKSNDFKDINISWFEKGYKFNTCGKNEIGNILHNMFTEVLYNNNSNLNDFLNNCDIDYKNMLLEKNKEGKYPLEILFNNYFSQRNNYYNNYNTKSFINNLFISLLNKNELPLTQIINGISLDNIIESEFDSKEIKDALVESRRLQLENSLDDKLERKKIKI